VAINRLLAHINQFLRKIIDTWSISKRKVKLSTPWPL